MASAATGRFTRPKEIPPLRESPFVATDGFDADRCAYAESLWTSQDELRRPAERQVEENVRMLLGQHWIQWSAMRGRYVDLLETMPDDERRWRHMPVLNRLMLWFVLMHARMNENPPVLSWQPGPDQIDRALAEVCDALFKYTWRDTNMLEVIDRLTAWMIPAGRAYTKSRIDLMKGEPIANTGPALLQLLRPNGAQILGADGRPIHRYVEDAPHGRRGDTDPFEPAVDAYARDERDEYDAEDDDDYELVEREGVKPPPVQYEGGITVDVLTPLEVRGSWGQQVPWHLKPVHMQKSLLTPLEAWEALGVELEPDVSGAEAEGTASFIRLLQGAGLFGAADSRRMDPGTPQEFCTIYEIWCAPGRLKGTERTTQSAGGRLLITAGCGTVIRDGVRPAPFKYTSPIRCFDFVNLPGRSQGTSPQEFLNGPVRTRNRLVGQKLAHATLASNPPRVLDRAAGLEEGQVPNLPGIDILVDRTNSKTPVEYVAVPALGSDVDEASMMLRDEFDQMAMVSGTEATAPTEDASGELVKELRFNSDRPVAATMKRMVIEFGRMGEDWLSLGTVVYDKEKIIAIVGDDNIARTITVYPELFKEGAVNVEPEVESMLPEGRGERQERAWKFWQAGVWGDPLSPQARAMFMDQARFPHMSQMTQPGGPDRATANQNLGKLLQGARGDDPSELPLFPWYDFTIFQWVTEQYMKSPEYLKLPRDTQMSFVAYWERIMQGGQAAAVLAGQRAVATEATLTADKLGAQAGLKPLAEAAAPSDPNAQGKPGASGGADASAAA